MMMIPAVAIPSHLPISLTPFIGRQQELAEIATRLHDADCRLLTLVGPGGIGKTRLAIETAATTTAFPDGTYFIALQSLATPNLIDSALSDALKIEGYGQPDLRQFILTYLSDKHLLLVLDNFEHLLDGVGIVSDILIHAPHVKLLATSREILNVQEEWLYHVSGMHFPEGEETSLLENYSAIQLFVQCARRAQPQFVLAHEQDAVRRICELVAGMPLGIELAAAWLKRLSCTEIAQELERGLDILETSARNVPERHRSMRVVLEQSWAALTVAEQTVFKRLAVFQGGFRREAAEVVAGASLKILAGLVDKSFLSVTGNGTYHIHELLRQYAKERLNADPLEAQQTADRHADYFTRYMLRLEEHEVIDGEVNWHDKMVEAIDNVRRAFQWAVEQGHIQQIYHLVGNLSGYYQIQYNYQEALTVFSQAVQRLKTITSDDDALYRRTLAKCMMCEAWYLIAYDRKHDAMRQLHAAFDLIKSLPPGQEQASILWRLAFLHTENGILDIENRFEIGERYAQESLQIAEASGLEFMKIDGLEIFSQFAYERGDFDRARSLLTVPWKMSQQYKLRWAAASIHILYALCHYHEGNLQDAENEAEKALATSHAMHDRWTTVHSHFTLGYIKYAQQDAVAAHQNFEVALHEGKTLGDNWVLVTAYAGMGMALGQQGNSLAAWTVIQTALQVALNTPLRPDLLPIALISVAEVAREIGQSAICAEVCALLAENVYSRFIVKDRARKMLLQVAQQLSPSVFHAAQARAENASLHETVRAWLNVPLPTPSMPGVGEVDGILTDRETEILHLIADGLSNKAIADKLVLTLGTVKWYVNQIFSKLHATSRTGAVARARELGILL